MNLYPIFTAKETLHWPKLLTLTTSEIPLLASNKSTAVSNRERRRHLKKKRKRKRHKYYRRLLDSNETKYLEIRNKNLTKAKRRYKVMTSKYHLKRKRTTEYPLNLHRRPTKYHYSTITPLYVSIPFPLFHELKNYLDPRVNKVYHRTGGKKRRQRRPKQTIDLERLQNYYYPFEEYFRQSEPVRSVSRVTNAFLKRIVEVSSYSDEEDSLQRNLNGALFYNGTSATETMKV